MKAEVVGWDPYDDVGVLRVPPKAHCARAGPARDVSPASSSGSRWRRSARPSATETSLSIGIVSGIGRTIPSLTTRTTCSTRSRPTRRSTGQLGRAAARRAGPRDRDRGADPLEPRVGVRGRRLRRPDRLGQALAPAAARLRSRRLRVSRPRDRGPDARSRRRSATPPLRGAIIDSVARGGPAETAGLEAGSSHRRLAEPALTVGGDAIVAIDGIAVTSSRRRGSDRRRADGAGEPAWFTVMRGGRKLVVPVTLGARP